jgi:hypothetical protein
MADRQNPDREVLTSLPRARPVRRSAKRASRPRAGEPASKVPPPSGRAAGRPPATPRRSVPPAGYAAPEHDAGGQRPSPTDVVGTAVQAAGELAQIGLALGRQTLKSVLGRLPRP